jgi:hypothetical protein
MAGMPSDRTRAFETLDGGQLDVVAGGGGGIYTTVNGQAAGSGAVISTTGWPTSFANLTGGLSVSGNDIHQAPAATPLVQTYGSILSDTQGATPPLQTYGSMLSDTQGSPGDDGAGSISDRSNYFDRNPWAAPADGSQPNDATQSAPPGSEPGSQDPSGYFDRNPWAAPADPDSTQGADNSGGGASGGYDPGGSNGGGDGGGGDGGDGG